MNKEVKCPMCLKAIGEEIVERVDHIKGLGAVPLIDIKLDYRKASHVSWRYGGKSGTLCRKCAKGLFPEGFFYKVNFNYHGKPTDIVGGGIDGNGTFATRESAEDVAKRMTAKFDDLYRVVPHKV